MREPRLSAGPVAKQRVGLGIEARSVKNVSGQRRALRPRTALVVEDDPTIRQALAGLLEDDGFEVMSAATLERARYILFESSHPVGVMVLDLGMPDGDGVELLRVVAQRAQPTVSVVLLSATPERVQKIANEYAVPFLTKPFDLNVVAATIGAAFENDVRPYCRSG